MMKRKWEKLRGSFSDASKAVVRATALGNSDSTE